MSNEEQNGQGAVQDRIARFMQAEHGGKKRVTDEERKLLQSAVGRLDQLLSASAETDVQALRAAADRLDLLLREIAAGKDVATEVKQRRQGKATPK
jgi:hypothetical protein